MKEFLFPYFHSLPADAAFFFAAACGILLAFTAIFHSCLLLDWLFARMSAMRAENAFESAEVLADEDSRMEFLAQFPAWL